MELLQKLLQSMADAKERVEVRCVHYTRRRARIYAYFIDKISWLATLSRH